VGKSEAVQSTKQALLAMVTLHGQFYSKKKGLNCKLEETTKDLKKMKKMHAVPELRIY
jgi:hypothetical protein